MREMEDRMGRDGAGYQDTITRLEADITKMKVTASGQSRWQMEKPLFHSSF